METVLKKLAHATGRLGCLAMAVIIIPVAGFGRDVDLSTYNDTFETLNENFWEGEGEILFPLNSRRAE